MNYFKLVNISVQNSSDYGVGEILRKFFLILAEKTSIIWPEQFYLLETSFGKFFLFWLRKFFWIQSLRKRKFYFVWPKKIPLWERNKTIKDSWFLFSSPATIFHAKVARRVPFSNLDHSEKTVSNHLQQKALFWLFSSLELWNVFWC